MITKITPLTRLPSKIDSFDYFVGHEFREKIKIGQLVTIPWRNKKTQGVVLSLESSPSFPRRGLVQRPYEALAKEGGGVGIVDNKKTFRARPITEILDDNPILTKEQFELIKKFSDYYFCSKGYVARLMTPEKLKLKTKFNELKFEDHKFSISKNQLKELQKLRLPEKINSNQTIVIQDVSSFIWLILHLAKYTKGQMVVLFPTIDLINSVASIVHKKCSGKLAVIHSQLNKGNYWNEYQKVLSRKAKIILSTRQGVFLPIQKQSKIIFFESSSQDFKQYDQNPRYDARIVASWLSKITNSDLIFTSSSIPLNKKFINLPLSSNIKTSIKLVDMKTEMQKKDFSIIADSTINSIKRAIQNNKKIIIISLREDSIQGVSVKKIAEVLTNQIKNCKIATEYGANQNFDVLITTAYSLEALKLSQERAKFSLAVFSSIEPLLAIPDFRGGIRTFNRLNFWKIMCQELQIEHIILQSYSSDNLAIRAFAYGETDWFIDSELKHRKELSYPPFFQLIKLWHKGNEKNEFDRALKLLRFELKDKAKILGPFQDKKDKQSLLLKIKNNTDLKTLCSLSQDWVVDRDPENIL